jgi:guanylate kinase
MNQQQLAELVANYQPDERVIAGLSKVHLLMVVGPTGVGKSTLIKASGLPVVIGDASRPPRSNEVNGVDNWFRSLDDMVAEATARQYVQLAIGSEGDLKGTHASSFPPSGPAAFTVAASAIGVFRKLPFASTATVVIVPPDYQTWMERISAHHTAPDKLALRLAEAERSYEFALNDQVSMFVLNDELEAAATRLKTAASGRVPDHHDQAREIVTDLLRQIDQRQ